jgi:DNA-binding CsgD family transcriptional regulator
MNDTNSIPKKKQGSDARMIRTILLYALEIPQVPIGASFLKAGSHGRLCDRNIETGTPESALISHYGLTWQEASLAVRLIRGRSLEQAATELCISSASAKKQLKRIFLKAELHSCFESAVHTNSTTA